jgi:3-oxoacyl-[acyl-carrier-protein] synthase II
MKEAQFPFAVALAALAIHNGAPYPAFDPENEATAEGAPQAALATAVGYRRFEGAALVAKA